LLIVARLPDGLSRRLREHFDCYDLAGLTDDALAALAPRVRGVVANGESVVARDLIERLPALEIISVFGVGYDGIDVAAARARGLAVTNTPDVLTDDVADFALALLLATARQVVRADAFVRSGHWASGAYPLTTRVSGSRLGIVGLGRIGRAVAQRAQGFGMAISYTGRTPKEDVSFQYVADLRTLAASVDFLAICAHGGQATRGLIDTSVLEALGPDGILINIARGSVVDESALARALEAGAIRAAGLDVFRDEPNVHPDLMRLDNVVLTPHMASGTVSTRQAMADLTFDNIDAHFSGRALPTPVA
jgi:lactate dehydrogenase-like 2-hydroxyacid dehydrogenase